MLNSLINKMILNNHMHFKFEEDFVENNIRCIPMLVRFKLDAVGIKLKLAEWSRFTKSERNNLMMHPCITSDEAESFKNYLQRLIVLRAGTEPTFIETEQTPAWSDLGNIHPSLQAKAKEYNWNISISQWRTLTNLQRFALLKLYRPGHENKNFPKAMREFGLAGGL